MLPYITIGDVKIPFFTIGFSLSAIIFIILTVRSAREKGIKKEYAEEIAVLISISSVVFSKIPLGLLYGWNISKFFKFWESGHSLFGGVVMGVALVFIYSVFRKLNFYDVLASLTYPAFFTLSAYRIFVCFPSGCCFGFPSSSFGITFSHESWAGKVFGGTPKLFPSQVVESVIFFFSGVFMYMKMKNSRSEDAILTFLFLLTCERFIAELIRYDIKEKVIKAGDYGISIWFIISTLLFFSTVLFLKVILPWSKEIKEKFSG